MLETSTPLSSYRSAQSGSSLCQIAVRKPKMKPPHSGCTSLVYTLTTSPGLSVHAGKTNSCRSSSRSRSSQPNISWGAWPVLVTCTYSSASDLGTTPSKKMQTISTTASDFEGMGEGGGVGVGVWVGLGVGVGEGVGDAVGVGDGVGVGVAVAVGAGAGVGVEVDVAVGTGRIGVSTGAGVGEETGADLNRGLKVGVGVGV